MTQQENVETTPDETVVRRARIWRDRDKAAIGGCDRAKRAEYRARQQLREAVDLLAAGDASQQ